MGLKMAECEPPVLDYYSVSETSSTTLSSSHTSQESLEPAFLPYWARYETKCAQNLLDYSPEPIEYDHEDEDYRDNCFFFPEDCSWTPPHEYRQPCLREDQHQIPISTQPPTMIPGLPDIKMLDAEALSDLLEDNLSPPEITTIMYDPQTQTQKTKLTTPAFSQPTAPSSPTAQPFPPANSAT